MNRWFEFITALILAVTVYSCNRQTPTPTAPVALKTEVYTVIVRNDSLGSIGGTGYFIRDATRPGQSFNPLWGDTVLQTLLDSNFVVLEFWFPQWPNWCANPFSTERQIVRLTPSDTTITRLGYKALAPGFTDACIRYWRHYTISRHY
jgi:hypothetical protein